jgi:hypothetical protein
MTTAQLIANIGAIMFWMMVIVMIVHRWRTRNGKRPHGPEE